MGHYPAIKEETTGKSNKVDKLQTHHVKLKWPDLPPQKKNYTLCDVMQSPNIRQKNKSMSLEMRGSGFKWGRVNEKAWRKLSGGMDLIYIFFLDAG